MRDKMFLILKVGELLFNVAALTLFVVTMSDLIGRLDVINQFKEITLDMAGYFAVCVCMYVSTSLNRVYKVIALKGKEKEAGNYKIKKAAQKKKEKILS